MKCFPDVASNLLILAQGDGKRVYGSCDFLPFGQGLLCGWTQSLVLQVTPEFIQPIFTCVIVELVGNRITYSKRLLRTERISERGLARAHHTKCFQYPATVQ